MKSSYVITERNNHGRLECGPTKNKVRKIQCKEHITYDTTENRSSRIKPTHKQANPSLNTQRQPKT